MVRALLLIFDPANTWEKIETTKHPIYRVFLLYLLPIMIVSFAIEGWLIMQFGVERARFVERTVRVPQDVIIRYEIVQLVLGLIIAFGGAATFRMIAQSFHRRHSYTECFATLGYSLGPYFLLRILDGWPALITWIPFAIGVLLALSVLYRGIPRLMKPDPSNALGVYLLCSMLLIVVTALAHFIATLVLAEKVFATGFVPPAQ